MIEPPRFGVLMAPPFPDGSVVDLAKRVEQLGYDACYIPDHFNEILSPIPALTAVAMATGLRVGPYMLANDLRHPAMVARDIATLDVLSEGRAEMGIGAGWWPSDYHAVGLEMDRPSQRIARLREAVQLIRSCWTSEEVHHEGRWYRSNLAPRVRPVQKPHPPIIVGGGRPKILKVAAEVADVISIGVSLGSGRRRDMPATNAAATFDNLAQQIRTGRADSERDARIEISLFRMEVTDRPDRAIEALARRSGVASEQVRQSPYYQVGTLAEVVAGVESLMAIGIESFVVRTSDIEAGAMVRAELENRRQGRISSDG